MPEIVEPAIPVEYRKDIALLWVRGREGSGTLIGLESPGGLYVPFAVCGWEKVEKLRHCDPFVWAAPRTLVLGILLACGDVPKDAAPEDIPTDAQYREAIEWFAGMEGVAPARYALDACLYARHAHGTEIAARTFRRADELFPEDEAILTRRIGTLWTYAELWRVISKNDYPKILELSAGLFADRYVKGTIPLDPERGYAVYAGLASLRLAGRGNEAVALRFGRIVEANLEPGELALAAWRWGTTRGSRTGTTARPSPN